MNKTTRAKVLDYLFLAMIILPFVFAIADRETGAVCFAGVVENPAEK